MQKHTTRLMLELPMNVHTELKMLAAKKKVSMKKLVLLALSNTHLLEAAEDVIDAERALDDIEKHGTITHEEMKRRLGL